MKTILLIEDIETMRLVLIDVLENDGYEVIAVEDGREGIKKLTDHSIDLILTDIYMPSQDGIETILQLRREHPQTPVIAMSGGSQVAPAMQTLQAAQSLGAHATIEKPFRNKELLKLVQDTMTLL
ncbi:MAG: response regulator [Planctomycetes bacterium]|nr:response regulator [Planctomycetota bacterium]